MISIKMDDGTRYDFRITDLDPTSNENFVTFSNGDKTILLNQHHIVSIMIRGEK